MSNPLRAFLAAGLLASSGAWAGLDGAPLADFAEIPGEHEFSGRLIVRPAQGLDAEHDAAARARVADLAVEYFAQTDEYIVKVPAGRARGEGENTLSRDLMATGLYQYAHPDWICYPLETIPNDPSYPSEWHHPVIQSPRAWDLSRGSLSVVCAFTDTGIDLTHPDLAGHRVPGYNAVTDLAEVDGGDVSELNGHGTHVSGCAAAIGNNEIGVAGVGWDLSIMMVRVALDGGGGAYLSDILEGARWAIEHGARVASSSYSGVSDEAVGTTGTYIKSIGGLYLYAAGNSGSNLSWFDYPDTIVVGATTYGDEKAWFSSYGLAVDVYTPGVDILSTCWGGGYCYSSGTSMATPIANGVIGMIWSVAPSLTAQQVEDILFTTSDDLGDAGNDTFWGWGRANVYEAVRAALDLACPGDFNQDGSLNIFDYLAFQTAFGGEDPSADLAAPFGVFNVFDFLAFQTAFGNGC